MSDEQAVAVGHPGPEQAALPVGEGVPCLPDPDTDTAARPWPPPWFGSVHGSRTDIAASAAEQMQDGFGQ